MAVAVPLLLQNIMIPFYEVNLQKGEICSPFAEQIQLAVRPAVRKIADHNQLFGFEKIDERYKPLQVFRIHSLRNGNARLPERPQPPAARGRRA